MDRNWPQIVPWPRSGQLHCSLIAIGARTACGGWRSDPVTMDLRTAFFRLLNAAFDDAGLGWEKCWVQDRGDSVLIGAPTQGSTISLVEPLLLALLSRLRAHNGLANDVAWLRLQVALHIGTVSCDPAGPAGHAIDLLYTLFEAPEFAKAFDERASELGLVISDYLYEDVVRHFAVSIEPEQYQPIKATGREQRIPAWTYRPERGAPWPMPTPGGMPEVA